MFPAPLTAREGPEDLPMEDVAESSAHLNEADWGFAVTLLDQGVTLPEVESKLLARGLTAGQVTTLLKELLIRSMYTDAGELPNKGEAIQSAPAELVERAFQQGE